MIKLSSTVEFRKHFMSGKEVVEHWLGAEAQELDRSGCEFSLRYKLSDLGPVTKLLCASVIASSAKWE